ncbi:hypothetical protein SAMN05660835_00066 [Desulfurella multipotens]|uniref:Dissimilatory sulfite reductase D (DsrD) n=1 Tax=Desulfurella multipotens TaxID=79269 RepID=A0A1G6HQ37_9BACT|nr:hypothetical protein [Desulfurella multipotens]SDB96258.1 hypothetical protein SAMN05660835_00066 [Desulfurella multipotens]
MTDEQKQKIKEFVVNLVKEYHGKKRFKPQDLEKEVEQNFQNENITRKDAKAAIKELTDKGELIYGYAGGSFLTLPEDQTQ